MRAAAVHARDDAEPSRRARGRSRCSPPSTRSRPSSAVPRLDRADLARAARARTRPSSPRCATRDGAARLRADERFHARLRRRAAATRRCRASWPASPRLHRAASCLRRGALPGRPLGRPARGDHHARRDRATRRRAASAARENWLELGALVERSLASRGCRGRGRCGVRRGRGRCGVRRRAGVAGLARARRRRGLRGRGRRGGSGAAKGWLARGRAVAPPPSGERPSLGAMHPPCGTLDTAPGPAGHHRSVDAPPRRRTSRLPTQSAGIRDVRRDAHAGTPTRCPEAAGRPWMPGERAAPSASTPRGFSAGAGPTVSRDGLRSHLSAVAPGRRRGRR